MQIHNKRLAGRVALMVAVGVAYFVFYPQDLGLLLNPAEKVLNLSKAVSPGLYVVVGAAIVSWTLIRIWGKGPSSVVRQDVPPT